MTFYFIPPLNHPNTLSLKRNFMPKLTLNTIGSRYGSIDALNDNFDAIETALENTLSRDGSTPNTMSANLDMNGYEVVNAGSISATSLSVNGVDVAQSLEDDYDGYVSSMQTIYNNYLSITQKVTVSTASPTGGADGDIWFKVSV